MKCPKSEGDDRLDYRPLPLALSNGDDGMHDGHCSLLLEAKTEHGPSMHLSHNTIAYHLLFIDNFNEEFRAFVARLDNVRNDK